MMVTNFANVAGGRVGGKGGEPAVAQLLNGEGEAGEVDNSCFTTSTQAATCPRSRSSAKKLVGEWLQAPTWHLHAKPQKQTETCIFLTYFLLISLLSVNIFFKQTCSLIKDLKVCLKEPPQNLVDFEDLSDQT
jgi:hypothetical protein